MCKKEEDIYIKILNWAKEHPNFAIEDINNKFPDYIQLIDNEINLNGALFCRNSDNPQRYVLSFEDRFRLLEYDELQEARKQAKQAIIIAIIAIGLNILGILFQIFF